MFLFVLPSLMMSVVQDHADRSLSNAALRGQPCIRNNASRSGEPSSLTSLFGRNASLIVPSAAQTFTIEPMICVGHQKEVHWPDDVSA